MLKQDVIASSVKKQLYAHLIRNLVKGEKMR